MEIDTLAGEANLSDLVSLPSGKSLLQKDRILLPMRANTFISE